MKCVCTNEALIRRGGWQRTHTCILHAPMGSTRSATLHLWPLLPLVCQLCTSPMLIFILLVILDIFIMAILVCDCYLQLGTSRRTRRVARTLGSSLLAICSNGALKTRITPSKSVLKSVRGSRRCSARLVRLKSALYGRLQPAPKLNEHDLR